MNGISKSAGFTLVELLITVAILAIVVALAAPSFNDSIQRNQRIACANGLVGVLQLARSEAVRVAAPITVTATAPSGIAGGVTVYRDLDGGSDVDPDEVIRRTSSCNGPSVSVASGSIDFSYLPDGQTSLPDLLEIEICENSTSGETGRKLSVLSTGVLKSTPLTCS
ncbi:GspH/FimT family pseudopilin [Microbulbifer guangxiensis]|uniref:GspH/FimT family pseudopilin n=1 Tax=Microbulbifer guangxiensis TaxID=2904249 RepID=UPI0021082D0B|nr:GspH/FimT family pseudopilin [Microbulbifer guangxiensis]